MKELQKKEFILPKISIKNEEQAMDPDNGITTRSFLTELIHNLDRIVSTSDDYMTDDQMKFPTELMEFDQKKEIQLPKCNLAKHWKFFLVRH